MRCKKHPTDASGTIGVCASCLRQRLIAVIAAQEQLDFAKSDNNTQQQQQQQQQQPPPISFPRSVSPYISRRKSDTTAGVGAGAATWQRFHTTPLVLPTDGSIAADSKQKKSSKNNRFASLFRGLFRSKSDLDSDPSSRPGVSADSRGASPSWLSTIVTGRRKKQIRTFSLDEGIANNNRRNRQNHDRGMSPARYSDEEEEDEHCASSEKQTPWRTPAAMRRGGTVGHNMNMANLAFCLSPLVRPSPNRNWNIPPETVAGESRVPTKPRLSAAASFCKNRSRKLADIGRYNYNPNY